MSNLLILGAGGFGHMVYECARQSGKYEEIAFLDDAANDSRVIGKCVDYQIWREKFPHAVAAFGNNRMRLAWVEKLQEAGFDVPCLCHPSAIVSPSVQMEAGCFVMQRAVLNTHVKLGKGAAIKVRDSSIICSRQMVSFLKERAKAADIPYQMEVLLYGGTDAGVIHLTREGVVTGGISIPARNIHSPVEMVDKRDVDACIALVLEALACELS